MFKKTEDDGKNQNKYFCNKCKDKSFIIECSCGCGLTIPKYDERGRPKTFINRHYWRGKTFSEEYKQKLSDAKKGKYKGENNPNFGKHLSEETKKKLSEANKGSNHPQWKGGRIKTVWGYYIIYNPNHPYCNHKGYVKEHRLVVEEYYTRKWEIKFILHPSIAVHHINGIKDDNRIENLEIMIDREHSAMHNRKNKNAKKDLSNRLCLICEKKTYVDKNGYELWHRRENGWICHICFLEIKRKGGIKNG